MAVIAIDLASGPYAMTYNGNDVGLIEGPIRHQEQVFGLPVKASMYGDAVLDYILRMGGVFVVFIVKEWNANAKAVLHPYGASPGIIDEAGMRMTDYAKTLVLTAVANTPAATEGPVTRTYENACLLPNHNLDITFAPEERNIPVVLGILPYRASDTNRKLQWYADT